jgi:large subunit ribosomal protein L15
LHFEVSDASKTAIDYVTKQGGSVKLIFLTPLKLREHIFPQKYPVPLLDPITPYWRVRKLQRKEGQRGIPISYPKPKWLVEDIKKELEGKKEQKLKKEPFVFPVPIV